MAGLGEPPLPHRGDGRVSIVGCDHGTEIVIPISGTDNDLMLNVIAWAPGMTGFALHVKTRDCQTWRAYSSPDTFDALPNQVHTITFPDVVQERGLDGLKLVPRGTGEDQLIEYIVTYKEVEFDR